MEIVATTSLPAVDRPNAERWNAVRLCQKCVVKYLRCCSKLKDKIVQMVLLYNFRLFIVKRKY